MTNLEKIITYKKLLHEQHEELEELKKRIPALVRDNKALRTQGNQFAYGVTCMARNTLAAVQLIRQGKETLDDMERWLNAVITNDAKYLEEAKRAIHEKMKEAK